MVNIPMKLIGALDNNNLTSINQIKMQGAMNKNNIMDINKLVNNVSPNGLGMMGMVGMMGLAEAAMQQQNNPYGQVQNNTYGQGQMNPYGNAQAVPQQNNPYGQAQNNPYGQGGVQSAYGTPQAGNVQSAYGTPQAGNVQPAYGTPQAGNVQSAYGAPQQNNGYGQAQNNPYGQPNQLQTPYAQSNQQQNSYGQPNQPQTPYVQSNQQQNPYGQPNQPQTPYAQSNQQQNPYGQSNQPQTPYAQNNQQQNPYGQPNQPQTPYGQSNQQQNPYGQPNQPQTHASGVPDMVLPSLTKQVKKGQKISLGNSGDLTKLDVRIGWNIKNPNCDVDVSAFMLAGNRVISDDWFVFYGQKVSPDGSTVLSTEGSPDREVVSIDLAKLNPSVEKIVFVVTINEALQKHLNFSMLKDTYVRVMNPATNTELVSFILDEYYANVTSMMVGEVYKHNGQWKFNAIGNGVARDLAGLCEFYGVQVE